MESIIYVCCIHVSKRKTTFNICLESLFLICEILQLNIGPSPVNVVTGRGHGDGDGKEAVYSHSLSTPSIRPQIQSALYIQRKTKLLLERKRLYTCLF